MTYHTLGECLIPSEPKPSRAEMAVRDLLSATETLLDMPIAELKAEIDDIELTHARLSRIIKRICNAA